MSSIKQIPWRTARVEFTDELAKRAMGWVLVGDDWHSKDPDRTESRMVGRAAWNPMSDSRSLEMLWLRCLKRTKEMGYEISQKYAQIPSWDNKFGYHINGDHPVAMRLLVIDSDYKVAVCRFAAALFEFTPPHPFEINPPREAPPA